MRRCLLRTMRQSEYAYLLSGFLRDVLLCLLYDQHGFGSLYHYRWGYCPKYVAKQYPLLSLLRRHSRRAARFWAEYIRAAARPIQVIRQEEWSLILMVFGCLACVNFFPTSGFGFTLLAISRFSFLVFSAIHCTSNQLLAITPAFCRWPDYRYHE